MTLLAAPIAGDSFDQIQRDIEEAVTLGAELIELRVDRMPGITDDQVRALCEMPAGGVPRLLTIRASAEGGDWRDGEEDRIERIVRLGPFFDYIDIEFDTWRASPQIRRRIRQALRRNERGSQVGGEEVIDCGRKRRLILSKHDFSGRPATVHRDLVAMMETPDCDVPKLAWCARSIRDNFEAFDLMRLHSKAGSAGVIKRPLVICMGEEGLLSRVMAKKFGAFATFAALRRGRESAPGQPSLADMRGRFRWERITSETSVYGVIGDPVEHSLSPAVHNAAIDEAGRDAVYLPMKVGAGYERYKAFMLEVSARPWLGFRGFSVTVPHKRNAIRYIRDAGGELDDLSKRIGAVNTLVLKPKGGIAGFNTDQPAALRAIVEGLGGRDDDLRGMRTTVLGAGGAARAVVAGLLDHGARVTVFNRTAEKAEALAEEFGCCRGSWEGREAEPADLLVNCTSVGLWPNTGERPLEVARLTGRPLVFDVVYNPFQTKLLREASARGCRTVNGVIMFAFQAQAQFEHWFGRKVPPRFFREKARQALSGGRETGTS